MKKILVTMMVLVMAMGMVFADVTTQNTNASGVTASSTLDFTLTNTLPDRSIIGFTSEADTAWTTFTDTKGTDDEAWNTVATAMTAPSSNVLTADGDGTFSLDGLNIYGAARTNGICKFKIKTTVMTNATSGDTVPVLLTLGTVQDVESGAGDLVITGSKSLATTAIESYFTSFFTSLKIETTNTGHSIGNGEYKGTVTLSIAAE